MTKREYTHAAPTCASESMQAVPPCQWHHTVTRPFTDKARTQAQTLATTGTFAPYLMVWRQPAAGTACWPGPVGTGTCRRWISWWHRWLFQVQVSLVKEAIPEGAPDEGGCRRNHGRDIKDSHSDIQRRERERDSLEEKKKKWPGSRTVILHLSESDRTA